MNNTQRILPVIYLLFAILIFFFMSINPEEIMLQYLKLTVMITLFLSVLIMRKKYREQKIMVLAFFFMVIGDYFFVIAKNDILGIGLFLISYIVLIAAFQRNFKVGRAEKFMAIPIVAFFLYVILTLLLPYAKGPMFIGTLVFGAVLCYMTWTALCTIPRRYFKPGIARIIAVAAVILFFSDMGVAYEIYHPQFSGHVLWLNNFVRGSFIFGWTLLAMAVSAENLILKDY